MRSLQQIYICCDVSSENVMKIINYVKYKILLSVQWSFFVSVIEGLKVFTTVSFCLQTSIASKIS